MRLVDSSGSCLKLAARPKTETRHKPQLWPPARPTRCRVRASCCPAFPERFRVNVLVAGPRSADTAHRCAAAVVLSQTNSIWPATRTILRFLRLSVGLFQFIFSELPSRTHRPVHMSMWICFCSCTECSWSASFATRALRQRQSAESAATGGFEMTAPRNFFDRLRLERTVVRGVGVCEATCCHRYFDAARESAAGAALGAPARPPLPLLPRPLPFPRPRPRPTPAAAAGAAAAC